jgi:hypothetical protein
VIGFLFVVDVTSDIDVFPCDGFWCQAADLVLESGDRSAAYHLGRQHEARGNVWSNLRLCVLGCSVRLVVGACVDVDHQVKDALFFYEKSGRYNHAVRIAKEAGMDNELVTLALQSSKRVQLDVARSVVWPCSIHTAWVICKVIAVSSSPQLL